MLPQQIIYHWQDQAGVIPRRQLKALLDGLLLQQCYRAGRPGSINGQYSRHFRSLSRRGIQSDVHARCNDPGLLFLRQWTQKLSGNRDGMTISAIILAGGRGTRLQGQDKGWVDYQGVPLILHVLARLQPQVDQIIVSCNRNVDLYRGLGFTVVCDAGNAYPGPMAGIAAAVPLCNGNSVLLSPCDTPQLPKDLVAKLQGALQRNGADVAIPRDHFGQQYLSCLLRRDAAMGAITALESGQLAVKRWLAGHTCIEVEFTASADSFKNINALEDLEDAATEQQARHPNRPLS
jgi:molybdopterin-guanine dinucleotide biosynthesis protein A